MRTAIGSVRGLGSAREGAGHRLARQPEGREADPGGRDGRGQRVGNPSGPQVDDGCGAGGRHDGGEHDRVRSWQLQ